MTNFSFDKKHRFYFYRSRILLCIIWLAGFFCGCAVALINNSYFLSWMRCAVLQPVSIVGLLVSVYLPLLLSYISLVSEKPIIILIVCFFKAAAFAFCGALIHQFYGNASWLVRWLYLFSDSSFLFFLFALWYRCLDTSRMTVKSDLSMCCCIGVLLTASEYFIVSPLLLGLL